MPDDPTAILVDVDRRPAVIARRRVRLANGVGGYEATPLGHAARKLRRLTADLQRAETQATDRQQPRSVRRRSARTAKDLRHAREEAEATWAAQAAPEIRRLDDLEQQLLDGRCDAISASHKRAAWLDQHPDAARRLKTISDELAGLERYLAPQPARIDRVPAAHTIEL